MNCPLATIHYSLSSIHYLTISRLGCLSPRDGRGRMATVPGQDCGRWFQFGECFLPVLPSAGEMRGRLMSFQVRQLDDETIQRLFGHEAAENEDAERLRQYYFKSQVYDRITSRLPLRILVGHKGIGKSALFMVAMQEDREAETLAILIRPDDVLEISSDAKDFLRRIRDWKAGLLRIIYDKALSAVGVEKAPNYKRYFAPSVARLTSWRMS